MDEQDIPDYRQVWNLWNALDEDEPEEETDPLKALDEELLSRKYDVEPWVREILLEDLERWLKDPKKGREWIWQNRVGLLIEGEVLNEKSVALLAKARRIAHEDPES